MSSRAVCLWKCLKIGFYSIKELIYLDLIEFLFFKFQLYSFLMLLLAHPFIFALLLTSFYAFVFAEFWLTGFIAALDGTTQENKMRFIQNFKWTDTLHGNTPRWKQKKKPKAKRCLLCCSYSSLFDYVLLNYFCIWTLVDASVFCPQCPAGCNLWTRLHGLQRCSLVHQVCLQTCREREVSASAALGMQQEMYSNGTLTDFLLFLWSTA